MFKSAQVKFIGILFAIAFIAILSLSAGGSQAAPISEVSGQSSPSRSRMPGQFLTGANAGDPLDIALNHIYQNVAGLGLTSDDVLDIVVTDQYTSQHNGVTHIYLRQRYQGIEVHSANMNINIAEDGSIINLGNSFVYNLGEAVNSTTPTLAPTAAVQSAAGSLGLKVVKPLAPLSVDSASGDLILSRGGISLRPIPVKLVYQPVTKASVNLAWDLEIYELDAQNWWSMRVDANSGAVLDQYNYVVQDNFGAPDEPFITGNVQNPKADLANSLAGALASGTYGQIAFSLALTGDQYNVYALPVESPNHGARTVQTDPADASASPFGWHDTNGVSGEEYTVTRGNNVYAYENGNNPGFSPDGTTDLNFDFPINLSLGPDTYEAAAVTNLFYWNNIIHDVLYQYGFDEASGNFQENNYGNGGAGSDSVNAEAQDGSDINNAYFTTYADGTSPRMEMHLWTETTPWRDGDLDNGIIIHEYGHGVSQRLTGGPSTAGCLTNAEQPGEGWSDFFTIVLTIEPLDSGTDRRGVGTYVKGQSTTGTGIRQYPYSTDMGINPHTYNNIGINAHARGSVWAMMVWEMTWALIDARGLDPDIYNGAGGNNIALQLVIDGLKLQPCGPGFVDARDAILLADQVNNGGENQCLIWGAFAKRGLGYSASQGSSNTNFDGNVAFDLPVLCQEVLKITKTVTPSPVESGSSLTYSLLVENDTTGPLAGVTATDFLPANSSYVPGSATCNVNEAGGVLTFPIGSMAAGTSTTCTFQVTVNAAVVQLFSDDMEFGDGNWSITGSGNGSWSLDSDNPHSPTQAWFSPNMGTLSDKQLAMTNAVTLGNNAILRFWHDYNTEAAWDGAVVEISVNGAGWTDLDSKIFQNGYSGTLRNSGSGLGGRRAFTVSSDGYVETLVDLSDYTGNDVQIRFRMASDTTVGGVGWYVDDVEILNDALVHNTACVTADGIGDVCDSSSTLATPGTGPGTPQINVNPTTLSASQDPNATSVETLNIGNVGSADLDWMIAEDSSAACGTPGDVPWVSAAPVSGTTSQGGSTTVTVTFDSAGLAPGPNTAYLCIDSNDSSNSPVVVSLSLTVTDPNPPSTINQLATGDIHVNGTVSGDYSSTHVDDDGNIQEITEVHQGGKPSNRHDSASHIWTFELLTGNGLTFVINAWNSGSPGIDDFEFYYSTDNVTYTTIPLTVASSSQANSQTASLGDLGPGTVYIKVEDSDSTPGNNDYNTLSVDQMYIIETTGTINPPATPANLVATTASSSQIDLTWDDVAGETGYKVNRVGASNPIATLSAGMTNYSDTGLDPSTPYTYTVVAFNGGGESVASDPDTATTDPYVSVIMHILSLVDESTNTTRNRWHATAVVTIVDASGSAVENAIVTGSWSNGANGIGSCETLGDGTCQIVKPNLKSNASPVTFTINLVERNPLDEWTDANGDWSVQLAKP